MDLVPNSEVSNSDKRNTKKMLLPTDAICVGCGIIFNAFYEGGCIICEDENPEKERYKGANEEIIKIIKCERDENICDHKEFIFGRQSVDLRILLDYHIEDLRALCEIHGCSGGSRGKMTINILKKLHVSLDKRIDEVLIRKMIVRNRKRFRYWKDIEDAVHKAKKPSRIRIIDASECVEMEINKKY